MNALKDGHDAAQTNTIHRSKHWFEQNDFKSVKPAPLTQLFTISKKALIEEVKFLKAIGQTNWPSDMKINRENLLRTTIYDTEIESNAGNGSDKLPELWTCFRRKHPGTANGIEAALKKVFVDSTKGTNPTDPHPHPPTQKTISDVDNDESKKRAEEEKRRLEE